MVKSSIAIRSESRPQTAGKCRDVWENLAWRWYLRVAVVDEEDFGLSAVDREDVAAVPGVVLDVARDARRADFGVGNGRFWGI